MTEIPERLQIGPKSGLDYPLTVQYCGNCTMPLEVNNSHHFVLHLNIFIKIVVAVL